MAKQILVFIACLSVAASNPLGQTVCEHTMLPSILPKTPIYDQGIISLLSYLASLSIPAQLPYGNVGISTTVYDPTANLGNLGALGTLGNPLGALGNPLGALGNPLGTLGNLGSLGTLGNLGSLGTLGNLGSNLGAGYPGISYLPYNNILSQLQLQASQQPTTTICETTTSNLGMPGNIFETSPIMPCPGISNMPMPCPIHATISESMPTTTVCETTPIVSIPNWLVNYLLQMQVPQPTPVQTTVCETSMPSNIPINIPMSNLPVTGMPMATLPMTMPNLPMSNMPVAGIPMSNMQLPMPLQGLPVTIQIV
ncbi:unnamed protein product [Colias eurytheme]|nr:unnamed protein product [Colias eurytheme]